jgi:hypothetical protein
MIMGSGAVALIAFAIIKFWAMRPRETSYDIVGEVSDADVIRSDWPWRLVQPEWVSRAPDWLTNWSHTEANVRLTVVCVGWLIITGLLIYIHIRLLKALPKKLKSPATAASGI